jgi:hypothetical protein
MSLEPLTMVAWHGASATIPAGNSLRFTVAWYDSGLYFFFEVTDPERNIALDTDPEWKGDAVELFVDHDGVYPPPHGYDSPGTFQFVIEAPPTAKKNSTRASRFVPTGVDSQWPPGNWIAVPTSTGYVAEALVVADDLKLTSLTLSAGDHVGFDIGHDVSFRIGKTGIDGNRAGQGFLKAREPFTGQLSDYPFDASDVFCTPALLAP